MTEIRFDDPAALDHQRMWERMRLLLERLATTADQATFLDDALDTLVELLQADRGLVVLGHPERGGAVNARAQGRALTPREREEVSRTVLREARQSGRCIVWEPHATTSAAESMLDLGILTAMAAPLRAPAWWAGDAKSSNRESREDGILGTLYVDFRDPRKAVGDLHREFFEAAATLIATALDQREKLEVVRESVRAARAQMPHDGGPGLEEVLRGHAMDPIRAELKSALHGDSSILILGESGTGKTRLAQAIAEASGREPIVRATLGSSDDLNTITSELFGHERGAFSGAIARRVGLVEHADGGTLVLDEILNLPPHAQQLLLDFTQFGTYRPLGWQAHEPRRAKVRILAATNGDLRAAIAAGRFREDLYYRLAAVVLEVPPLRARREEIPAMAEAALARLDRSRRLRLSVASRRFLLSEELPWRGNVRELEAMVARARERALAEDPEATTIRPEHLEPRSSVRDKLAAPPEEFVAEAASLVTYGFQVETSELADSYQRLVRERAQLDAHEKQILELALEQHRGVVAHVARALGVARTSLISRMDTLGIPKGKG